MLKTVHIRNYRGFEEYSLKGLQRVNLLVGKNNAGKTALLESVHLLATGGDVGVFYEIANRRGEVTPGGTSDTGRLDLSHFFYGHTVSEGSSFSVHSDNGLPKLDVKVVPLSMDMVDRLPFDDEVPRRYAYGLTIACGPTEDSITLPIEIMEDGAVAIDSRAWLRPTPPGERSAKRMARFISPDSMSERQLRIVWDQIITASQEAEVIQAMRILDPSIGSVAFLTGEVQSARYPAPRPRSTGVVVGFNNGSRRIPLGSCGDGMRRLLAISAALIRSKGGFLIVDEIDTGFHYSIMGDLWKLVIRTAMAQDVQVFATTHSLDCIRGLAKVCREDAEMKAQISLNKIAPKLKSSVPFSGEELVTVDENEIEVR
jgi:hypothetical protein